MVTVAEACFLIGFLLGGSDPSLYIERVQPPSCVIDVKMTHTMLAVRCQDIESHIPVPVAMRGWERFAYKCGSRVATIGGREYPVTTEAIARGF